MVATKFGWDFYGRRATRSNLKRDYILFALDHSLKRLGRDWIDIYQVHHTKPSAIEEHHVYETLDELKKSGKVGFYGISAFYLDDGVEAIKTGKVDTVQAVYNILQREAEEKLFPLALENNVGIIAREPLSSSLLSGKYDENSRFPKNDHRHGWSKKFLSDETNKVVKLKFLEMEGRTLVQAALGFSLSHNAVSIVIPGAKTLEQVEENAGAAGVEISSDEYQRLRRM